MDKKINVLTKDKNFKMLFGSNQNIHILTSFLSSYLKIPYSYLKDNIELLKQELDPEPNLINQTVDVLVKMPNGNKIQIEMNRIPRDWTNQRNFLYAIRSYLGEFKVQVGKKTEEIYKQDIRYLQINFNAYKETNNRMTSVYKMQNKNYETLIDNFEIHTINIPECKKAWYNGVRDNITRWASLFETTDEEELWEIVGDDLMAEEAKKEFKNAVRIIKKDDPCWWDYEWDYQVQENTIRHEARQEGLKEGREEGIEQGREEGREEGRNEEKLANALNFKKLGVDTLTISKATGLTIEQIENLK